MAKSACVQYERLSNGSLRVIQIESDLQHQLGYSISDAHPGGAVNKLTSFHSSSTSLPKLSFALSCDALVAKLSSWW